MSQIEVRETHEFEPEQLADLFLSVEWSSGHYPERLAKAMRNFETVFAAWDGELLVGLISAMDDGSMTAYVHYLLVRPGYQDQGIGKQLVELVKERYANYLRIVVIAYDTELGFYEHCGFEKSEQSSPMFITSLWT
ncbi:MAG: GNAT family N-acetyltransferase [Coriobacteriales bacterium]|nr:GNAT family N-acetyltransferase [Coriobacteriales bacterium]